MLDFLASLIIDSIFLSLLGGILAVAFIVWLNRKDSRTDERFYKQELDPGTNLSANIHRGKDTEPPPEEVLRAYAQPIAQKKKSDTTEQD